MNDSCGRPLDDDEVRALRGIERDLRSEDPEFPERLLSHPGLQHPPVRQTGTPLTPAVVFGVVGAAVAFAALLYLLLPEAAIVPVVLVIMFVLLPAGCLVWARRSGEI